MILTETNCQGMTRGGSCSPLVWELTEKIMQIAKLFSNNVSCLYDDWDTLKPLFTWHDLDIINYITLLIASINVFLSSPQLGSIISETMPRPKNHIHR